MNSLSLEAGQRIALLGSHLTLSTTWSARAVSKPLPVSPQAADLFETLAEEKPELKAGRARAEWLKPLAWVRIFEPRCP